MYHGDLGPDTAAQWERARAVPDFHKGGHGRIKQREPMHLILFRARIIDVREREAAAELLNAWEDTATTGEVAWMRPFVDGGSGGEGVVSKLAAQEYYNLLMRQIPSDCQYPIGIVILGQRRLADYATRGSEGYERAREQIPRGLRALARYLRC